MKQIFKIIFFVSLMLSFNFADMIKDNKTTLQDQNLTKQVDELCEAIIADDYDKVKAMLDENPELVNLNDGYFKPLDYALVRMKKNGITEKRLKIFEILISKNIDLNYHVGEGFTPLQLMTLYFDESYLEDFIIKNRDKIDMNLVYKKESTLLSMAYKSDKKNIFKFYLKNGVNTDYMIPIIGVDIVKPIYEQYDYIMNEPSNDDIKKFNSIEFQKNHNNLLWYLEQILDSRKAFDRPDKIMINELKYFSEIFNDTKLKNILKKGENK